MYSRENICNWWDAKESSQGETDLPSSLAAKPRDRIARCSAMLFWIFSRWSQLQSRRVTPFAVG